MDLLQLLISFKIHLGFQRLVLARSCAEFCGRLQRMTRTLVMWQLWPTLLLLTTCLKTDLMWILYPSDILLCETMTFWPWHCNVWGNGPKNTSSPQKISQSRFSHCTVRGIYFLLSRWEVYIGNVSDKLFFLFGWIELLQSAFGLMLHWTTYKMVCTASFIFKMYLCQVKYLHVSLSFLV